MRLFQFNKHLLNVYNKKEKAESGMVHSAIKKIPSPHWEMSSKQNEGRLEFRKTVNKNVQGVEYSRELKEP